MNTKKVTNIAWKVGNLSPDLASVRYRAILPILALNNLGIKSSIFDSSNNINLDEFDALFIIKSFTPDDLMLAQQAQYKNKPVLFDLCDNIFIPDYKGKQIVSPAEMFRAIMPFLSGITVTTSALQDVVNKITCGNIPCFIVPDGIETRKEYKEAQRILSQASRQGAKENFIGLLRSIKTGSQLKTESIVELLKTKKNHLKADFKNYLKPITWIQRLYTIYDFLRAKLTGAPRKVSKPIPFFAKEIYFSGKKISKQEIPANAKKVIWFGNHGAKYAQFGILDLLPLRNSLEKAHTLTPIELVVISNNRDRFVKYIANFKCFTRYVEWSANAVESILQTGTVCLVPNSKDEFSICKSANRTVLSLNANVPVIATLTPGLKELESAIYCDDPYLGLIECLTQPAKAKEKVIQGKKLIKQLYGSAAVGSAAMRALTNTKKPEIPTPHKARIVVALHLIQDYELAKPLISALKNAGESYIALVSFSLARKSFKTLQWLSQDQVPYMCLPDEIASIDPKIFNRLGAEKFLTMAETNLGPHKFTHTLTQLANLSNVNTYTFQHGYENIGITYSDNIHDIKNIDIAANHILTWGNADTFHPDIKKAIKEKTIPVGCIKPVWPEIQGVTPIDELEGLVIGIFENLHWHRYSASYQKQFLLALDKCAEQFPDVTLFIKPHPAGMWLTSRYKGELPKNTNIIIANPSDPKWETPSFSDYLRNIDAVISTPSTVVLDAARAGLPTLVCGFDLTLHKFAPLCIAKTEQDWCDFVETVKRKQVSELTQKNIDFINSALINDDAINNTLKLLSV